MKLIPFPFAFASALLSTVAQAAVVTLDFDGAVNTNITHAYAGLTFDAPVGTQVPVRTSG